MLKPAPVTVTWEIATATVPVFVKVSVCRLLDPVATLPKLKLVALATSVPTEVVLELVFADGALDLVKPTQPERDNVARKARKMANNVRGVR
jgi:hypothetical protein